MKPEVLILLSPLLLASSLSAFAQPVMTSSSPVQRELIYCADQMSHEERETYRIKMQAAQTPQDKEAVRSTHRRDMQERARIAGRDGLCEQVGRTVKSQYPKGGTAK